jgi:hypothetical protein
LPGATAVTVVQLWWYSAVEAGRAALTDALAQLAVPEGDFAAKTLILLVVRLDG